jgi:GDP-4-dehydro-6-deoxy-D-mannose reductase
MRVLVTGVCGFAGRHVAGELAAHGHEVIGLDREAATPVPDLAGMMCADIREPERVRAAVAEAEPEACIHLAGIAFVPYGWEDPSATFEINLKGTIHVLEGVRQEAPGARFLFVSSANIYGRRLRADPIAEDEPPVPADPYCISKAAADQATLLYAAQYGLHAMSARPYNHIGPGQSESFAVASFAAQVRAIAAGTREPVLSVGNLDSECYFTDVRDVAAAYRLLVEQGRSGEAYNIATAARVRVGEVLDVLCELAGIAPEKRVDPDRFRPAVMVPALDTTKIRRHTGWRPQIPLRTTLNDVLATP